MAMTEEDPVGIDRTAFPRGAGRLGTTISGHLLLLRPEPEGLSRIGNDFRVYAVPSAAAVKGIAGLSLTQSGFAL